MSESNQRKTTSHTLFRVIVWVDVQWRKTTIKMSKSVAVILHKSFSATIVTLDICCHDVHPYEKKSRQGKLYVKFDFCHEKYQHYNTCITEEQTRKNHIQCKIWKLVRKIPAKYGRSLSSVFASPLLNVFFFCILVL